MALCCLYCGTTYDLISANNLQDFWRILGISIWEKQQKFKYKIKFLFHQSISCELLVIIILLFQNLN